MFKYFFKRTILHMLYQLMVLVPTIIFIMLPWWFLTDKRENLFSMLMLSFAIGLWIFTALNMRLRLPNYDIWESQPEDTKKGIYFLQFIFSNLFLLFVIYNFSWFSKFSL